MTTAAPRRTWVEVVMGLPVSVVVRGAGARTHAVARTVEGLYADLRHVDRIFSTYRADSEVSLLRSGALPLELASVPVREVLRRCAQAREETAGWFDAELPDGTGRRRLDPSGFVKGWAVERAAGALARYDDLDWLVNAGGDVLGRARLGPPWRVAVEDPRDRRRLVAVVPVTDGAVTTSGTAARGAHVLDPHTGAPAASGLLSATVVGPSLTVADVHATAAFAQGSPCLARVARLPGYEALLVAADGTMIGTPGMPALLADRQATAA